MSNKLKVRWMVRSDLDPVLSIEQLSFGFPMDRQDFLTFLRQRNCIGMVAEADGSIHGYMLYEMHPNHLLLASIAVHPECRLLGVGSAMINKLIAKLGKTRNRIVAEVRETNVPAQLFLRQSKFRAVKIRRNAYEETSEDAYLFKFVK
jgi:ribosomal-protein-alanine N-acetyltransferase